MEKLNLFFLKIKEITFWQRLFSWKLIRNLSYDAFEEFRSLQKEILRLTEKNQALERNILQSDTKNEGFRKNLEHYEDTLHKKEKEIELLIYKSDLLNSKNLELQNEISRWRNLEEERDKNYKTNITQLNQLKDSFEKEIRRHHDEKTEEQRIAFEKMKRQWSVHEADVSQALKMISQTHLINYVDKVPFRGNPDNTIMIADEYIIFDAKCPSNNDLINFPKYLKAQTESVKKYASQEGVKKDIFLVIPTNTIDSIKQYTYNMGDYNVYIIAKDSLEPIILTLKKIEDYEFVNQMSPEERDNICRIIGRFAHTTKRKIQIDQFFASQFLELLAKCKNDLPEDILKQVIEFEKADKLNPPAERKSKQIIIKDLQERHDAINAEAGIRNVIIPLNFEEVKNLE